ncbi:hypothetical protein [Sphingomonas endophytica]|uniref:hypothetical protein n=1 Tax=Sphingomonas endophytica TaxID=869719 RepID=UPI00187BC877|nr:hypothetical protein [Sphingomonas endophytica]
MSDHDDRAARLAAQLRANLRRRKEQARGVAAEDAAPSGDGGVTATPDDRS